MMAGSPYNNRDRYNNHRPSRMRRTIEKIKSTTGLAHDSKNDEGGKPHPHPKVEGYVNTIGYSLIQEIMQYLKGPYGEAAMENILDAQSRVISKLASTEEARKASRVAAQEFMAGSYDAVQQKWLEFYNGLPPSALHLAILAAFYVVMFALGLLLTCWRFALYGVH